MIFSYHAYFIDHNTYTRTCLKLLLEEWPYWLAPIMQRRRKIKSSHLNQAMKKNVLVLTATLLDIPRQPPHLVGVLVPRAPHELLAHLRVPRDHPGRAGVPHPGAQAHVLVRPVAVHQ